MPFAVYALNKLGPILSTNSVLVEALPEGLAQMEVTEGFRPEHWWVSEEGELIAAPADE